VTEKIKKSMGLMSFIITPLAFALVGYLLIYIAFAPSIDTVSSMWNFVTAGVKEREEEDLMINRLDGYTESVPSSLISFPKVGDRYGELTIESAGIKAPVYFGDNTKVLKKGVGQYAGSTFIGSGSTVLLSGHNNTFLHTLGEAQIGDTVLLSTNYGDYVYEVESTAIKAASDTSAFDLSADYENLVIYTCYPFDTLGLTNKRYFVYCKYVSGPVILYDE
jgi:sortase A